MYKTKKCHHNKSKKTRLLLIKFKEIPQLNRRNQFQFCKNNINRLSKEHVDNKKIKI
jgi:hypothetical protein